MNNEKTIKCFVSHRELSENEAVSCYLIKDNVYDLLIKDFPSIERNNYISIDVLNDYRRKYLQRIMVEESGQLNILEAEVLQSIANNKIIAENVDVESVEELSLGNAWPIKSLSLADPGILFFPFSFLFWCGLLLMFLFLRTKNSTRILLFCSILFSRVLPHYRRQSL